MCRFLNLHNYPVEQLCGLIFFILPIIYEKAFILISMPILGIVTYCGVKHCDVRINKDKKKKERIAIDQL